MSGRVLRLRRVSRNVGDLARMIAFYCEALDFALVERTVVGTPAWGEMMGLPGARAQMARLRLGAQALELVAFDPPGRPYPADSNAADLCFQHLAIVVADMPAAYARLQRHACRPISQGGPQTLPPDTGGVTAFKFRDPEGHPLELIRFPAGVGAPCWQEAPGLFLGIDHSAIAVADVEASVAFYARLGLHVAGRSHNRGPEQQHLDGLPGADADVVGLVAGQRGPPHLELLGYRTPHGRRLDPPAAANDRVADRLVLAVDDLPVLLDRLRDGGAPWPPAGDGEVALLLDPSGHRLLLEMESATPGG
ncbi:VOC family protein [Fulvimonas yonginensis]|uniref:VOC family protein n=1 Tax=Fulvimonas yonginensis TaxID=1495200 RepID=A0ABU8J8R0_9GAMM